MATKKLARQLGLIRRKSIAPAGGSPGGSKSKQLVDYLIVIDFESTCWNDGKQLRSQEIIEFPAVLLNTSTGEIESEFHAYVQPQEHPILSDFCMELTGIKQVQVDEGVPLKICLSQFCKWIHKIQQQKKIIFATGFSDLPTSQAKLGAFVTWSDWDLGVCLEYECKRKQLLKPVFLNSWIDLRVTYKNFYRRKPKGLSGALQEVGIEFLGREHSGLDDSRNTALLAWKMIRDGCLMKITRSLNKVPTKKNSTILAGNVSRNRVEETSAGIQSPSISDPDSKNPLSSHEKVPMESVSVNCIGQQDQLQASSSIKAGPHNVRSCVSLYNTKPSTTLGQLESPSLNPPLCFQKPVKNEPLAHNTKRKSSPGGSELLLVSTTVSSVNHVSDGEVSSAVDCLPMLADWEDMAFLPVSQPEQNTDCRPPHSDSLNSLRSGETSLNFGGRVIVSKESEMLSHENFGSTEETPQRVEASTSIVFKSPHTTIYNVKETKVQVSDSDFKLPGYKSNAFSVYAGMSHAEVLGKHPLLGGTKRNLASPPTLPLPKKQTFSIHEEKPLSSDGSLVRHSSPKILPSILTSTNNIRDPWKTGKMTPPLCKCGRRSKRLVVSNNGPNHGKVFYCCPSGKYQENRKCCGYFKWEHTLQKEKANSTVLSHSPKVSTLSSPETSPFHVRGVSLPTEKSLRLRPSMRT
ncbi:ERI1 exoribonuclease 2 isoform X2 [Erinaceus europaeus]|uniref:ERI1 exoribonuclease 2 n=1 Tax=Erinaceus europaeus TaxID=9365 RepID=A0A1S3W371_ERIEU|nr:ERI1 exoribonuclease 2 isoform X2 [Erinaceus europaeus]